MSTDTRIHPRHVADQLVVALDHRELILNQLRTLVRRADVTESNVSLGLGLVTLTYRDDAPPGEDDRLDRILRALYEHFRAEYGGWVPTFGKNRLVDPIGGSGGYLGGGGSGLPTPHGPIEPRGGKAGRGVRVAVLDTRLFAHEQLDGRYITDRDNLLSLPHPLPYAAGHAAFVTGLIARRAPSVAVEFHSVLDDEHAQATAWQVAVKMAEFVGSGVAVLNLSMGCFTLDGQPPLLLQRAVELLTPDIVIVAAAGNHNHTQDERLPYFPGALDDVVAVGAHDNANGSAPFSPDLPWVALLAPGVEVVSTYLDGEVRLPLLDADDNLVDGETKIETFAGFAQWSGTSFAAATVTGEIAALTVPGHRSAHEALNDLMQRSPGETGYDIWPAQ